MIQKESSGNPGTVSSTGASGLLQFTRGTGKQYGLVGPNFDKRQDPVANIQAGVKLTQDNFNAMKRILGRDPTNSELALGHQQGGVTGAKMVMGTGNAPAHNLAVNNVPANLTPQQAAAHIQNYYGFDKPDQGVTLTSAPASTAPAPQTAQTEYDPPAKPPMPIVPYENQVATNEFDPITKPAAATVEYLSRPTVDPAPTAIAETPAAPAAASPAAGMGAGMGGLLDGISGAMGALKPKVIPQEPLLPTSPGLSDHLGGQQQSQQAAALLSAMLESSRKKTGGMGMTLNSRR